MKGARCPCGIFLDLYVLDPVADGKIAYELQILGGLVLEQAADSAADVEALSGPEGVEWRR